MKHSLYFALVALLLAAGCTKESGIQNPGSSDTVEALFSLCLNGPQTKAFADGLTATRLIVGVYDKELGYISNLSVSPESADHKTAFAQNSASFSVRLVKGHGYDIVFLAVAPDNGVYTVDLANATLTAKVDGASNLEARDAFYALYSVDRVTEAITMSVSLKRPLAQINVITNKSDYEAAIAAGVEFEKSSLKIKAPKVLNLLDGTVGSSVDYTLSAQAMPQLHPNFAPYQAQEDYWILTDYILASPNGSTSDVTFGIYAKGSADELFSQSVPNVPLKRNWRTNIVGNVLTVNGQFTLTVEPGFTDESEVTL